MEKCIFVWIIDTFCFYANVCGDLNQIREGVFHIFAFLDFFAEAAFFVIFVLLCQLFLLACIAGILVGLTRALYIHMEGEFNTYFALATYPIMFFIIVRAQKYSKPKRICEKIGIFLYYYTALVFYYSQDHTSQPLIIQ